MAKTFEEIARSFLGSVKSDLDPYTSVKGEIFKSDPRSFTLSTPDHIQFAFAGRGPGKMPPLEKMLELVESKNILFEGLDKQGTAFAIGMAIKYNGTKNHKPGAPNLMETTVTKYQNKYEKDLGKFMSVELNDKIKAAADKMWEGQEKGLTKFTI